MKKYLLILSVLWLSACTKLSKENYNKLEMGMTPDEVMAIIGKADHCSETLGAENCLWGDEADTFIKVTFLAGRAATFSHNGIE